MALNRTILYGYQMVNGEILPHPEEKEVVRQIFKEYAQGASYKTIAQVLTAQNVPYLPEKTVWNKNMVARILQNQQYLGSEKYHAILSDQEYRTAQNQVKPYKHSQNNEVKMLKSKVTCQVCGEIVERKLNPNGKERWRCKENLEHISPKFNDQTLLDGVQTLWKELQSMPICRKNKKTSLEIIQLENSLKQTSECADPEQLKQDIFTLAMLKFQLCECPEFHQNQPFNPQNIEKIHVQSGRVVAIQLK